MAQKSCECLTSGPLRDARATTYLGLDHTRGRFAEVEIEECTYCRRRWLHYELEYEDLPGSSRWFRGLMPEDGPDRVAPEVAAALLEALEWYFAGGEFFGPRVMRLKGPPQLDR